jgi:DNA-binding NarL/FixJ family response regulator
MNTRVALVEDDEAVRANLARLVGAAPGFSCVAACASAEAALRELPDANPDVVLMDIHLPGASGIECVARLRQRLPATQIIMLTVDEDAERVFESLKAGANGYLVKHVAPEEILGAIGELRRGGAPMSSHIARMVVTAFRGAPSPEAALPGLSARESEVLHLLARGFRSKEIGDELRIGVGTVNTHVRHIYEKLHVRSRAEAVSRLGRLPKPPGP